MRATASSFIISLSQRKLLLKRPKCCISKNINKALWKQVQVAFLHDTYIITTSYLFFHPNSNINAFVHKSIIILKYETVIYTCKIYRTVSFKVLI